MARVQLAVISILLMVSLLSPRAQGKLPLTPSPTFHAVAWEQQGRVKLAIANASPEPKEFSAGFGYYLLGQRILEEVPINVPGKTILVTTHPMVRGDSQSGYRIADMVFVSEADGRTSAAIQIIGVRPATEHYVADSFIVPAGQNAVVYIKTPDPELGIDTTVYLSIGKTFTLGYFKGKLRIDRVYEGGLKKASNPPLGEGEKPQDFYNYSYGWRGLKVTASTPRLEGVERLDFVIEELISTPEGTARHGLNAPPILVYGPDITLMEK
ncbi:MAG: hypothetical protein GX855_01405 [Firmicutes bacterium]|nr:hypothetical protein [Bacillota bacterium]